MVSMIPHFLQLADIQFGDPAMLLWGLAALLPILIHWLNRQKHREVVWAAMAFLLAAVEKHSRRLRIQQLLLLAVRIATLLLFAVALSDISCQTTSGNLGRADGPQHTVIVLDGSFSMAYRASGQRLFDRALVRTVALIEDSPRGDGFTLVVLGDPPETVIGTPVFGGAELVREVRLLTLQHQRGNLEATLVAIESILENARQSASQFRATRVCFLTDMGRSTWDDLDSDRVKQKWTELAEKVVFEWIDVGEAEAENWAVTSLRLSHLPVWPHRRVELLAECRYYGHANPDRQRAQWFVDGKHVGQQEVQLSTGKATTVRLSYQFAAPGEHIVEVRLNDDLLEIDNHRWLSVPIRNERRILCVGGKPGAARFVRLALQPATSNSMLVRPKLASELALCDEDLSQYDCVILCNVSRIDQQQAEVLFDYVDAGGGIIVFLGDKVDASAYNGALGGADNPRRILPAEIGTTVLRANYGFDPLEYRHQIAQPFRGNEQAGLLTTPVWKYFQLRSYREDQSDVALAFHDGNPAIVTERIADGTCVLVATAASTASVAQTADTATLWTAWPTWPSFPPLVHEMVLYATRGQVDQRNTLVNQPFGSSLPRGTQKATVHIDGPDDRRRVLRSEGNRWSFAETSVAGIYAAQADVFMEAALRQLFTVNVDSRESDLERYDGTQVADLFPHRAPRPSQAAASRHDGQSWFRLLLMLVGILLLLESCLAWRWNVGARG